MKDSGTPSAKMNDTTVDQRGFSKPSDGIRKMGGTPSMNVPGDGDVAVPVGALDNRSAAHYAEAMKVFGGPAVPERVKSTKEYTD